MNLAEFFSKYRDKHLDYDGVYGNMCVDVIKAFFVEVLGYPAWQGNAIDYWTKNVPGFQKIEKSLWAKPKPGDIVVFKPTPGNPYGHIGIVNWSRLWDFGIFEQNYPEGAPCGFRTLGYYDVLGWLRPNYPPEGWLGQSGRPKPATGQNEAIKEVVFKAWIFGPKTPEIQMAVNFVDTKLREFSDNKLGFEVAGWTEGEFTGPSGKPLPDSEIQKLLKGFNEKCHTIIIFYNSGGFNWTSTQYIAGCPEVPIVKFPLPWTGIANSLLFEIGHCLVKFYNSNRGEGLAISNLDNYSGGEGYVKEKVQSLLPYLSLFKVV